MAFSNKKLQTCNDLYTLLPAVINDNFIEMEKKVYTEYIDSNGNSHQILKGVHPEQCEQYYKAKEEGDAIAMHYLGLPYCERPHHSIQSELNMIEMKCELDRELAKPKELIELEMRVKYGSKRTDDKPKSGWKSRCTLIQILLCI